MYPGGDYSDWKLVSNSSKRSILGHYKGNNLSCDMLCVQKVKINLNMRSPVIILSI